MYHGITTWCIHIFAQISPLPRFSLSFTKWAKGLDHPKSPPFQAFPERFPHGAKFAVTSTIADVTLIVVPARPQAADHWPLAIEESAISRARALYGVFFFLKGRSLC